MQPPTPTPNRTPTPHTHQPPSHPPAIHTPTTTHTCKLTRRQQALAGRERRVLAQEPQDLVPRRLGPRHAQPLLVLAQEVGVHGPAVGDHLDHICRKGAVGDGKWWVAGCMCVVVFMVPR